MVLTRAEFVSVVNNAAAGLGLAADISKVVFPMETFLAESDIGAVEQSLMQFVDGLTAWSPPPQDKVRNKLPMVRVPGGDFEAMLQNFNDLYVKHRWGDGLPLVPPTPARVEWILRGTDESRDLEVGKFGPRGGIVTMETLAIALTMAGGRPEYLPVLEAAVRAILQPALAHAAWQSTSSSTFPVVVVNGPMAREIHINHGFGLLGPDSKNPAGGVVGRAIRLLQQNVGGAQPGVGTMAMFGMMRHTNAVFAEDEEGLPDGWEPFNTERFCYAPGANTVAVCVCSGASNIVRRGIGTETREFEAAASLRRVASYMRGMNINSLEGWEHGSPGVLVISRTIAQQLAGLGWTKQSIKEFLWKHSRIPLAELDAAGMEVWLKREKVPTPYADPWPITGDPENIAVVVAGGAHPTHNLWMQTSMTRQIGHEQIKLPKRWEDLLREAQKSLGFE